MIDQDHIVYTNNCFIMSQYLIFNCESSFLPTFLLMLRLTFIHLADDFIQSDLQLGNTSSDSS